MHIHISPVLEIRMDCHGGNAADAEYRLEQAGPRTQVSDFPQEFHGVPLRLQRIVLRAVPFQHDGFRLDFRSFRILVAGDDLSGYGDGAADMQRLDLIKPGHIIVIHHLRISEAGSVEEIDEPHIFLFPMIPDPSLQCNALSLQRGKLFLQLPGGNHVHGLFPPLFQAQKGEIPSRYCKV